MLNKLRTQNEFKNVAQAKRSFNSNSMVIKFTIHSEVESQLTESRELQNYATFP
jgi:RNase P protein component